MKKPISQADYHERITNKRRYHKENTEPSLTVPGQAQTIMQIMSMFASGIPPIQHTPIYNDGEVNETMRPDYDIVDATESLNKINASLEAKKEAERLKKLKESVPLESEESDEVAPTEQKQQKKSSTKKQVVDE